MINWFLYFHTYFGWILIESGGQYGIGGEDMQGNNRVLKRKRKEKKKEWDLAFLFKNSIPCKHICYYLVGAARSGTGCLRPPYGSRRQVLHEGWAREGEIITIVTSPSTWFTASLCGRERDGVSCHLGRKGEFSLSACMDLQLWLSGSTFSNECFCVQYVDVWESHTWSWPK